MPATNQPLRPESTQKPIIVTLKEVIETLGISKDTLRAWVADGYFPGPSRIFPNKSYWHREVWEEYLESLKVSRDRPRTD